MMIAMQIKVSRALELGTAGTSKKKMDWNYYNEQKMGWEQRRW